MSETAEAWVTLATNDSYAMGALVLGRSLRRVNTTKKLAVMITPGVSGAMKDVLTEVFDVITEVNILDSEDAAHLALLDRPELGITFTKIHCWKLTQFTKCVFMDADTLVIQNSDELFEREELSAAPDAGWPDCFNSGVFVFRPSVDTYNRIHSFALSHGSFDGGDQGLLNMYFNGWSQGDASRRLPFIYNMVATASYSYLPAFKVFGPNVKIVHFIGQEKPWLIYFDSATGLVRPPGGQEHMQELLQAWWNVFRFEVHPRLSPEMGGGQSQSATMVEQVQASFSQIFVSAEPSASQFLFQPPPAHHHPPPPPSHHHHHHHHPPPHPEPTQSEQHQESQSSSSHHHHEHQRNPSPLPAVYHPPPPPPEPPLLVAIQRYPPDHFWREPPPPPPVIPEYQPPPPPPPSPPHVDTEHSRASSNHTPPPQHESQQGQSTNAQTSAEGGSGSPHQDQNSSNHSSRDASHHQDSGPRENASSKQRKEEKRRKRRSKPKGIAAIYAKMSLDGGKSIEQIEYEDQMRKMAWEQGHIDYMGKDSFDNIMKRIQASMAQTSVQKPPRKQTPPQQAPVHPPPPPVTSTEPQPTPQVQPPPKQEPPATQEEAPKSQPPVVEQAAPQADTAKPPPQKEQEPVPVVEPKIEASKAQMKDVAPSPEQTSQEEEERKALEERQAVERKLAEQRKVAEQKLQAEKQAAAAAAASAAASASKAAKDEQPVKAPPRKVGTTAGKSTESQNGPGKGAAVPYGTMSLGILGAAVILVFAMYAVYSPASFFL